MDLYLTYQVYILGIWSSRLSFSFISKSSFCNRFYLVLILLPYMLNYAGLTYYYFDMDYLATEKNTLYLKDIIIKINKIYNKN
jgi:hypothetical protein